MVFPHTCSAERQYGNTISNRQFLTVISGENLNVVEVNKLQRLKEFYYGITIKLFKKIIIIKKFYNYFFITIVIIVIIFFLQRGVGRRAWRLAQHFPAEHSQVPTEKATHSTPFSNVK